MATKEGMPIEGEPPKRYRISYSGTIVGDGSWDSASEALEAYSQHADMIRVRGHLEKPGQYRIADGREEINIRDLKRVAENEQKQK
jgi:hypothetical protein